MGDSLAVFYQSEGINMDQNTESNDRCEMKVSAYNLIKSDADGSYYLANTMTGAIMRLSAGTDPELIETILTSRKELSVEISELTNLLLENGFIISPDVDELVVLKQRWERSRVGIKALGLAVIPTLSCNFRCDYCYEEHVTIDMSPSVQQSILAYVERNLPGRELLKITWFGGEPLLRPKVISTLSERFIQLTEELKIKYTAAAVTNGYLLTTNMVNLLITNQVTDLQITMDGSQADHDRRRILINGKPTYQRILQNLLTSACEFHEIILRINIDTRNSRNIESLLNDLLPIKNYVIIAFRPTLPSTESHAKENWALTPSNWWQLQAYLVKYARDLGYSFAHGFSLPGTPFCSAYQLNSISVDPYGDVHTCPVFIGKKESRLGRLTPDGRVIYSKGLQKKWTSITPFSDKDCIHCKVLPICMGGCPLHIGKGTSSFRCFAKEDTVTNMLSDYFLNLPVD
jgi:uncharacterized protein